MSLQILSREVAPVIRRLIFVVEVIVYPTDVQPPQAVGGYGRSNATASAISAELNRAPGPGFFFIVMSPV